MSPRPRYQERPWIYVLGPNQTPALASVTANQVLNNIPLQMDQDAPFLLRGRAFRVRYDTSVGGSAQETGLNQVQMRFSGPDRNYFSQIPIPQNVEMYCGGQLGRPKPVYPQVVYPASSTMFVDITNNGSATLTNLTFYWFGVKLFPWGLHEGYTYPPKFATVDYTYDGTVQNVPVATPTQGIRNVFTANVDTDFVLRNIVQGNTIGSDLTWEIFMRLYDSQLYPYMSDFVHLDVIAGSPFQNATYPVGPTPTYINMAWGGPGWLPVPEIYIPFQHFKYYDILRQDTPFVGVGAVTQSLAILFKGAKVFKR